MIGIYKFENKINGNIYIGQSTDIKKRYQKHLAASKNPKQIIHKAIKKYGDLNGNLSKLINGKYQIVKNWALK